LYPTNRRLRPRPSTPCTSISRGCCPPCNGKECRGNRDLGRCGTTDHPRLHRYRARGPSAMGHGVSRTSGRSVGGTRRHHRLRSQQLSQTRPACGGGEAPMGRPPGQGRQLPGRCVHGLRLSPRACLARLPFVPAQGSGHGTSVDAKNATCPWRCGTKPAKISAWRCSTSGGIRCPTAG
jgi:hypothetical protein